MATGMCRGVRNMDRADNPGADIGRPNVFCFNDERLATWMNFDEAFDRLIGHEGGYSNRSPKDDPGGETNWGISKRSYPRIDIKNLTRDQAKEIYRTDYWLRGGADKYDGAIGYQFFDAAVNSGIENAVRFLQRAVGVADDGNVGPITIATIKAMSVTDVLARFNAERLEFMTKLSNWDANSRGWARRIAHNLRYGAIDA